MDGGLPLELLRGVTSRFVALDTGDGVGGRCGCSCNLALLEDEMGSVSVFPAGVRCIGFESEVDTAVLVVWLCCSIAGS